MPHFDAFFTYCLHFIGKTARPAFQVSQFKRNAARSVGFNATQCIVHNAGSTRNSFSFIGDSTVVRSLESMKEDISPKHCVLRRFPHLKEVVIFIIFYFQDAAIYASSYCCESKVIKRTRPGQTFVPF